MHGAGHHPSSLLFNSVPEDNACWWLFESMIASMTFDTTQAVNNQLLFLGTVSLGTRGQNGGNFQVRKLAVFGEVFLAS